MLQAATVWRCDRRHKLSVWHGRSLVNQANEARPIASRKAAAKYFALSLLGNRFNFRSISNRCIQHDVLFADAEVNHWKSKEFRPTRVSSCEGERK
jgi:hypothetical protein